MEQAARELQKNPRSFSVKIEWSSIIHALGLLNDGFFKAEKVNSGFVATDGQGRVTSPEPGFLHITEKGKAWAKNWLEGLEVEAQK